MTLTAQQLSTRRTIVTATDIVKLAGQYPGRKGACDVYAEKLDPRGSDAEDDAYDDAEDGEPSLAIRMGHVLEPVALAEIARLRGLTLSYPGTMIHPTDKWMGATPDAIHMEFDGHGYVATLVEVKVVGLHRAWHWGRSGTDEVPDYVRTQCQWQMTVAGANICLVVALIGTELRWYRLEHSDALEDALVSVGREFYEQHMLPRIPPPVDGSEGARQMLLRMFPRDNGVTLQATAMQELLAANYFHFDATYKFAEKDRDVAKQELMQTIGDNCTVKGDGWNAHWKTNVKGSRVATVKPLKGGK